LNILATSLTASVLAVETFIEQELPFDPYSTWLSEQMMNYTDFEVDLGSGIPEYLQGIMINAGPSLFKIGKYELGNYGDGFVRFNKYAVDAKNEKMTFSTKLVNDTKYYKASTKAKEPQMLLFAYPTPKRLADRVPGINAYWCGTAKQCDNIGVMSYLLPDKKTYIFLTDEPDVIEFNPDTLAVNGYHTWEKDDCGIPSLGVTHVLDDPNTGDMVGVLTSVGRKHNAVFYRVSADNVHLRKKIGEIPVAGNNYYHSFGMSKDYVLFPEQPVTIDVKLMLLSTPMAKCFVMDFNTGKIKFHLMKMSDASIQSFEADHFGFIMHTGNLYQDGDNFIVDYEMTTKNADPFDVFDLKDFVNNPDRLPQDTGSVFRRYTINTVTSEVTWYNIMAPEVETVGFPIFNPTFRGIKHCFTYITEIFIVAKNYSVVKIDHCNNNTLTRWNEPGVWMSEPYFIDDPTSDVEDDGVIMMSVYDDKIDTNRFVII